jgi:hypothetical protein
LVMPNTLQAPRAARLLIGVLVWPWKTTQGRWDVQPRPLRFLTTNELVDVFAVGRSAVVRTADGKLWTCPRDFLSEAEREQVR